MKAYEIISDACFFTDNLELGNKLDAVTNFDISQFEQVEQDKLKVFLRILNLVQSEVADYAPLRKKETLLVSEGKLAKNLFATPYKKILAVTDEYGTKIAYKEFEDYIQVNTKSVNVEYCVAPQKCDFTTEVKSIIPERILAYGMTREYFLKEGLFEDAEIWENRFKDGLKIFLLRKSNASLPKRRWL